MDAAQQAALREIQRIIIRVARTPEAREEILQALAHADWDAIQARAQYMEQRAEEEYQAQVLYCHRCEQPLPRRDLIGLPKWDRHYYCPSCAEHIRVRNTYVCLACGKPYLSRKKPAADMECCSLLHSTACGREHAIVVLENSRARKLKEPATLTLKQWVAALTYFSYSCAYCGGPYQICDHFLPLGMGAGSTQSNCVPSCQSCNIKKGKLHPDQVKSIKAAQLHRVRGHLALVQGNQE